MNYHIIEDYIEQYKDRFPEINQMKIYKWKAVKHFQKHWDIEADDFAGMLKESLDKTKNLLGSGNYFPRRMVKNFAQKDPEEVRRLFKILYNQSLDLEERYTLFKEGFDQLSSTIKTEKDNHYQDHRAVLVYLSLKFPQDYYLYKFGMFGDFCDKVGYPYSPVKGDFKNVREFQQLCSLVKAELLEDNDLLNLHHKRLLDSEEFYQDPAYTLLTQDFIYACVNHLDQPEHSKEETIQVEIQQASIADFTVKQNKPSLNGKDINYERLQKTNSVLGSAGERYVLEVEQKKLEKKGIKNTKKYLDHTSVSQGDGLGYDIKSIDENGDEIFIEVKATSGGFATPFYITRNELYCSQQNPEKYRLYRLYDFDAKKKSGKIKVFSGDLSEFCIQAVNYQVALTVKELETV